MDEGNLPHPAARCAALGQKFAKWEFPVKISTPKDAWLNEEIAQKRVRRLDAMPASAQKLFVDCWTGKCSPRKAIKAQCMDCQGFDRQGIYDCASYTCPLWAFRPQEHPPTDITKKADTPKDPSIPESLSAIRSSSEPMMGCCESSDPDFEDI